MITRLAAAIKHTAFRHKQLLITIACLGFMSVASLLTVWPAILSFANVQDATVYPYLFDHYRRHDIILPGNHANFLKFPLFALQAVLPHSFAAYVLVNLALAIGSLVLWALLIRRLLGLRVLPLTSLVMGCMLIASFAFSINFAETTIRNIEYPLALYFLLLVNDWFFRGLRTNRLRNQLLVIAAIYAVAVAGDSLLMYVICGPLLALALIYWLIHKPQRKAMVLLGAMVVGIIITGTIIRHAVVWLGLFSLYFSPKLAPHLITPAHLLPSILHALHQVVDLYGSRPWDIPTIGWLPIRLFNFITLLLGAAGLMLMLVNGIRNVRLKTDKKHPLTPFIMIILPVCAIATLSAYILSDQVFATDSHGVLVDAGQARYITLVPLLCILGLAYGMTRFSFARLSRITYVTAGLAVLCVGLSATTMLKDYHLAKRTLLETRQVLLNSVAMAKADNVSFVVTGDTTGAPLRFWSHDTLQFATFLQCSSAWRMTHNSRNSWFKAPINPAVSKQHPMGLLIDRTRMDAMYSQGCTKQVITTLYGKPEKVELIENPGGAEPVELWLYDKDIRPVFHT